MELRLSQHSLKLREEFRRRDEETKNVLYSYGKSGGWKKQVEKS